MPNIVSHREYEVEVSARLRSKVFSAFGMHRSGTSLCASMLNLMGINVSRSSEPNDGDGTEHFEHRDIVGIHDKILQDMHRANNSTSHDFPFVPGWWSDFAIKPHLSELTQRLALHRADGDPVGLTDPRLARLLPIWKPIFRAFDLDPHYIICLRNPAGVAESLRLHDALDVDVAEYRWLVYNVDALKHTKGCKRIIVDYEDWFDEDAAERQINRLIDFVGHEFAVDLPELKQAMRGLVSDEVDRSSRSGGRIRKPIVRHYYNLVRRLASEPADDIAADIENFNGNFLLFQQLTASLESVVRRARKENEELASALDQSRLETSETKRLAAETAASQAAGHLGPVNAEVQAGDAALASALAARDSELEALRAAKTESDRLLGEAQASHEAAAAEAGRLLRGVADRAGQLERMNAEAEARYAALASVLAAHDSELDTLRAEKAEADRRAEAHASQAGAAEEAGRLLQEATDRAGQLEQANAQAQARHAELVDAVGLRDAELAALRAEKAEADRLHAEALASHAAIAEQANSEAQARHVELVEMVGARGSELDALRAEKAEADRLLAEALASHAPAADEAGRLLQEATDRARQLEQANGEAQARHVELVEVVGAREAELNTLRAEKAEADRRLAEGQAAHAAAADEAGRLLQEATDRARQLEQANAEAQAQHADIVAARDSELDKLRAGKVEAERLLGKAHASHATAAGEARRLLQEATSRARELEQANAEAQSREADLARIVAAREAELDQLHADKIDAHRPLEETYAAEDAADQASYRDEKPSKRRALGWFRGR